MEGKCFGAIWFQLRPWVLAWMSVSSSLADHDELRVPPATEAAAEAVETECRWEEAFSILGMLIMRRWKETGDDDRKRIDPGGEMTGVEMERNRSVYYNYGESRVVVEGLESDSWGARARDGS